MKKRGVALVELQVAMTLLLVASLAVSSVLSTGIRSLHRSEVRTVALYLAKEKLEEARASRPSAAQEKGAMPPPYEAYSYEVTRKRLPDHPRLEQIRVIIKGPSSLQLTLLGVRGAGN
ncbi:MAG: hypothetical protein HYU64_17610 [Armatimonadetes bacterium]|nr:hypothetical protein [Armatimonadota bacterium]